MQLLAPHTGTCYTLRNGSPTTKDTTMEPLPGYDQWKTTPPDPVYVDAFCEACGDTFDGEDYGPGEECPTCGEELQEGDDEMYEPCRCVGTCYC
jgi:hypothetical protein